LDVSTAGVRRSPVITPDVVVGKGEEEVGEVCASAFPTCFLNPAEVPP
jgi:hypothetical protein